MTFRLTRSFRGTWRSDSSCANSTGRDQELARIGAEAASGAPMCQFSALKGRGIGAVNCRQLAHREAELAQMAQTGGQVKFNCDEPPVMQQCRRCRGWYDREAGFRQKHDKRRLHISGREFHATCIPCEQTARDEGKRLDPFTVKARSTIRRHAMRYKLSPEEFIRRFGWHPPRVAHLLRHAFENTCEYCRQPYSSMGNGEWDVTMDIIDPDAPPDLETNTKVCCQTCNREKSNTPPRLWARKLRVYEAWRVNRTKRGPIPTQGSLF